MRTSFRLATFDAPPDGLPTRGIRFRNRNFANTLTTATCSAVVNAPFTWATTGLHCSQVACLLPELSTKGLPDNPVDGHSIYSGRRWPGPGAIEATLHGRRRIGITLSGTNSKIHPGEHDESEYRCRPTAVRRDNRDNRASTRSARRARNRDRATREAGTASRASPRSFRLPHWGAKYAPIKLLLVVFIAVSPTAY